ncbi:MAG: sulfatase-like hydrolase/transferase [Planctomycetaceae bacterium]
MRYRSLLLLLVASLSCRASASDPPNILLAISDDQSYPHCSAYGCQGISTPGFDRVAQSGVLFTRAYAASPGCSPCRAALLTGRHCWQIEQAGTHASSFPLKYRTYPELLGEAGYFVGHTGKGWGPGNHRIDGRQHNPAGPAFSGAKTDPVASGIANHDYAANFRRFLAEKPAGQPFCFWYGGNEPHRAFEKGSGLKQGRRLEDVDVPPFLPDTPEVRSDILDYYLEIEWFDRHLADMLATLDAAGELDNTLVIVTSDNGMSFPRAKANGYEYGVHMPLAVQWPSRIPGGRTIDDLIGFVDLTATILDAAGVDINAADFASPERQLAGRSLLDILARNESGRLDPSRSAVYSARERHSSSRYQNLAYPIRTMRTDDYLVVRNFRPERWPAGAPRKLQGSQLGPKHGGYHDIDACPTLDEMIRLADDPEWGEHLRRSVGLRPELEVFDVNADPGCLNNLATEPTFHQTAAALRQQLESYLRETGDPRVTHTDGGDVFETYPRYSGVRQFPEPDWARVEREALEALGWRMLFDGETLDGWKVAGPAESFSVVNGAIRAQVPALKQVDAAHDNPLSMAHLYYVGPDGEPGTADDDFTDFEFAIDSLAAPGSNGGVYFHTSWQETGFPNDGHEMQLNNSHSNATRTGSLFSLVDLAESPVSDNEFVTQTIRVAGKRVTLMVNGAVTVDYTEPEGYQHPRYTGRNIDHGTFALQAHDPASTTFYRNIRVRPLRRP